MCRNPNEPVQVPFKWEPATSSHKMEYLDIGERQTMKQDLASRSRIWGTLPLWHNVLIKRKMVNDEL